MNRFVWNNGFKHVYPEGFWDPKPWKLGAVANLVNPPIDTGRFVGYMPMRGDVDALPPTPPPLVFSRE